MYIDIYVHTYIWTTYVEGLACASKIYMYSPNEVRFCASYGCLLLP